MGNQSEIIAAFKVLLTQLSKEYFKAFMQFFGYQASRLDESSQRYEFYASLYLWCLNY